MHFYGFAVGILAVWRITHLLEAEDGPWNLLLRLRERVGNGPLGELLDCFYCLSLWVAVPFAWLTGEDWKERLLLWPALSGAAILLERLSRHPSSAPEAKYSEDQEQSDVLRQESGDALSSKHVAPRL